MRYNKPVCRPRIHEAFGWASARLTAACCCEFNVSFAHGAYFSQNHIQHNSPTGQTDQCGVQRLDTAGHIACGSGIAAPRRAADLSAPQTGWEWSFQSRLLGLWQWGWQSCLLPCEFECARCAFNLSQETKKILTMHFHEAVELLSRPRHGAAK